MADGGVIVDSAMDFAGAVAGTAAPREVLEALCLIDVRYRGFDGRLHQGQLVVHRELAAEIREIFALMERWDSRSPAPFRSSATAGPTRRRWPRTTPRPSITARSRGRTGSPAMRRDGRSTSTRGRNPAVYPDGRIAPAGAVYRPGNPGTFTGDHPVVRAFRERGWRWGGDFTTCGITTILRNRAEG